jgi:hypothetical protein
LFTKINANNLLLGNPMVDTPPPIATIAPLPITNLEITNTAGVISLKLVTTDAPPEGTMLWGSPWANSGVRRAPAARYLGTLGTPANGKVDITAIYTARFGAPPPNSRVFVKVNASVDGWQGQRLTYSGRVPASS